VAVLALAVGMGARAASSAGAEAPDARPIAGELTRLDLGRRSVVVKTEGRDGREMELATGPETRLVARGRPTRFEDLRPGDRVVVIAAGGGGRRAARVIKVVSRAVLPGPSPSAPPSAAGSPG
jgi:hypothetical protein